jgi:putative exosortase-associated protein (TIGR04073 family)
MIRRWLLTACVLALALGGPRAAGAADVEAPPPSGPLSRALRGVKDIIISPLEVPATIRRVAHERDACSAALAGTGEGLGNFLMRLTSGAVELVTFPIPGDFYPLQPRKLGERATPPSRPPVDITRP